MAIYSISYSRPGERPAIHKLKAKSEPEARLRFLNLSWVAFQSIVISSIGIASDQPEEAKEEARKAGKRKVPAVRSHQKPPPEPKPAKPAAASASFAEDVFLRAAARTDWRAECDRVAAEIGTLADEAQAHVRKGEHDEAQALRDRAKRLSHTRNEIIRRNTKK